MLVGNSRQNSQESLISVGNRLQNFPESVAHEWSLEFETHVVNRKKKIERATYLVPSNVASLARLLASYVKKNLSVDQDILCLKFSLCRACLSDRHAEK